MAGLISTDDTIGGTVVVCAIGCHVSGATERVAFSQNDPAHIKVNPFPSPSVVLIVDDVLRECKAHCCRLYAHDAGVVWNDPELGIKWPIDAGSVVLSEKDERLPRLRELPSFFGNKS